MSKIMVVHRCPKCGHSSRVHVFDSNGSTRCPECPQEVCNSATEPNHSNVGNMLDFGELTTIGIKPIGEMTERELVEEIMHAQYAALTSSVFSAQLKRDMVAKIRISSATARIYREAGTDPSRYSGMFGWDI